MPGAGASYAFCIPPNANLLAMWDLVEDRLFKIRHCMNIDGVVRELPLFEPPIDPALLVRARAAGLDLSSVLDDVNAPPPIRRFRVLVQKAQELCGELKALGSALLSALEKRDAEELTRIRAGHERAVLEAVRETRNQQIAEAETVLAGLEISQSAAKARFDHYTGLLAAGPLAEEDTQQEYLLIAGELQVAAQITQLAASAVALQPNYSLSWSSSGDFSSGLSWGGDNLHNSVQAAGFGATAIAGQLQVLAGKAGYSALKTRREQEWQLQADLADHDVRASEQQIAAQQIRIAIAKNELRVQELQIENAQEIEDFLRQKYTSKELYDWMIGQLSALYFQTYKLTFDLARRAEKAFRFERAEPTRSFVSFGAWESLRRASSRASDSRSICGAWRSRS